MDRNIVGLVSPTTRQQVAAAIRSRLEAAARQTAPPATRPRPARSRQDRARFSQSTDPHRRAMLAAARKILGDADAQDAVQTTLLAVWLAGTLDLSRPRAFLLTAVRRESIRMLKRLRRSGFTTPV